MGIIDNNIKEIRKQCVIDTIFDIFSTNGMKYIQSYTNILFAKQDIDIFFWMAPNIILLYSSYTYIEKG